MYENTYTAGSMVWSMVIPSMFVVLAALAIMVACIYFMSFIIARVKLKKKAAVQTAVTPKDPVPVPPAALDPGPALPEAPAYLSGETLAAICAAVACVIGTPHTVTSIVPVAPAADVAVTAPPQLQRRRPVWGFAGMQQNTRPF